MKTGAEYPGGFYKFTDEGGKAKDGNLLAFIELDSVAFSQYDWFAPNKTSGLTQAGLARINQSIEAFVYRILGAQVNVRSSIIGAGGRAKEAQTEFLGAFHLIKISENSGSGVNGKRFFSLPERKISGKSGTAQKVVPFVRLERLDWFRVPIAISW